MTDLKAVIDLANRVFEGFFKAGDMTSLAKLYTEDGALYPPNAQGAAFHGHEQIAAFWTSKLHASVNFLTSTLNPTLQWETNETNLNKY